MQTTGWMKCHFLLYYQWRKQCNLNPCAHLLMNVRLLAWSSFRAFTSIFTPVLYLGAAYLSCLSRETWKHSAVSGQKLWLEQMGGCTPFQFMQCLLVWHCHSDTAGPPWTSSFRKMVSFCRLPVKPARWADAQAACSACSAACCWGHPSLTPRGCAVQSQAVTT